ncbi:MAG TPA: sulfotransferase [Acetobacteraceae bacterium]|nr:sulfotransferase [Acetobacteraceae bacterium]
MAKPRPDLLRDLRAGLAFHRANRLDDAEAAYRNVLRRAPKDPDALNLLGVIIQERGRPAEAVQMIASALRVRRNFPEALTNLARAQRAAGDPEGAAASARRAVALVPDLAEAHVQLGRALLDLNDDAGAAEACRRAVALDPGSLDAQINLAAALTRLKDFLAAAQVYQEAHRLKPDRAETLTDFAVALTEIEHYDDALRCHERAVALAPGDPRVHASQAVTLKRAQDPAAAVEACRRALALAPDRIDTLLLLGGALASLGRFDTAIESYRRVLELDPDCAEARRAIVVAGVRIADAAELTRLRAIADAAAAPTPQRAAAGYALGTLLDQAGEYDAAFAYFASANRLRRASRVAEGKNFDHAALRGYVDGMIAGFTPAVFAATRGWGDPSESPVFIVGMPRSGTTLTEQIAASHPDVYGAGERQEIGQIAKRLEAANPGLAYAAWNPDTVRQEAAAHLGRMRGLAGDVARVTDKMPDNILYLGVIALLFPRARIVLCRRDLRDVCLSCHFQSFSQGMPWTNDLEECASRALEIERLIRHWRSVLPLRIVDLHYESLVADLEGESRRLIEFLDLPWDPACLDFHVTERQVMTASLWQVRQPLFASSVGRWRHYAAHIGPLIARLEEGLPPAEAVPAGVPDSATASRGNTAPPVWARPGVG